MILLCLASGADAANLGSTTFSGTVAVGSTSQAVPVTLTAQAAGVTGAPLAVTEGVAGLDFTISDPGTCAANTTLTVGQTCTVQLVFSPRFPGVRRGAVLLTAGGQLLASAVVSGVGKGSLPVLAPGEINTVAGDGQWVYHGDGVLATEAPIFLPTGLAVDAAGNLFLSDSSNNRVRRVDAVTGMISTVAGNGNAGSAGDGAAAVDAELNNPSGLALDGAGNLYIADSGNNAVRRVDVGTGLIHTVAGIPGNAGYLGDGQAATSAKLSSPQGLALAPSGDLLIADMTNAVVRLLTVTDGKIQTVAGTGTPGYNGDGVAATQAQLNSPWGIAARVDGAFAIADMSNHRVRLVDTNGNISTVAGTGQRGFTGDGGAATGAQLNGPAAVAFDPAGDLMIADSGNNRVRGVYGSPGIISTVAGNSSEQFAGDTGAANAASMYGPYALLFDAKGNIWISDMFHNRVREISGSLLGIVYPTMRVSKVSAPVVGAMYNGGNDSLLLSAPALNEGALDPATTRCGASAMAPMAFCSMGVEFAPTQVGPNVNGTVRWPSSAPNVTPVDALSGEVLSVEPTTVTVSAGANPGLLGQPVTLTGTVTSDDTGRTGTVTFTEGSITWCNAVTLAGSGTAACRIPGLSLGTHAFTAAYSGDPNNAASTSLPYTETIKQQPALVLAASTSPAVVTSNITLTLSAADITGTPTGTVVFYDGATVLATLPLDANGRASWSSTAFTVGTHPLTAQYAGDGSNVSGTSNTVNEQIQQASTATVLTSGSVSAPVGAAVVLTAKVVSNNGPAPTGSVQFKDGGTVLGTAPLGAGGYASWTVSTLSPGTHNLLATYSGDTEDAPSTSNGLNQTIQQIGTGTTLGADASPVNAGATLHLTAIVEMVPGATADGALTGTVTFRDGATVLGTEPVNATGQATLAVSTLSVSTHALVASFGGNTVYATSQSATLNVIVQQTATSVGLSSTSATTLEGKPASFTATVTSASGVPTGSISFRDGSTTLRTVPLSASGSASLTSTQLAAGTHTITAVYSGDTNYLGATSIGVQQTVQLAQPTLTLSGPAGAVDAGTTVQLNTMLATPGLAPTGTLTLLDGANPIAMQPVMAAGAFSFTTTHLAVGSHTLKASYSGDGNNAPAVSIAIIVTMQQANTVTALATSANPLTQGGALSVTASISTDSPNAGGTVSFYDGTTLLGTTPLNANGTAIYAPQNLSLGSHSLTAVYAGDSNHAGSTSAAVPELVVQSATAALSSSVNPSVSGRNVSFTLQITGSAIATGTAIFRDNGAVLGTVPLNAAGAAIYATSTLAVGSHVIAATYSGDSNFSTVTAQTNQTVNLAGTQATIAGSANPAIYGQPLSFTSIVSSDGGAPTGTVTFTDGGVAIGSAVLDGNGTAILTLTTLAPGAHTVIANYAGDGKAGPSSSAPLALAVKQTTGLTITSNSNPALTLTPVNLTAVIANAGAAPATGSVSFADGATTLGSVTVDGSGRATLTVPQMSAGTHNIAASYAGDGTNFASTATVYNQVVQLRSTVTTVTGSPTDASNPQQITLIAVVKGQGSSAPSGAVSFTSGSVTLGQATVDGTGVATITVDFQTASEPVLASYAGDAAYAPSQSGQTTITAGQAAQFTLTVNQASVTLVSHQRTTVNVALGSVKGFTDTIALGCLGLPFAATCTFDQTQLKLAPDGTVSAALIIDTGDPLGAGSSTGAGLSPSDRSTGRGTLLCLLPAGLLLGGLLRKGRRKHLSALLVLLFGLALAAAATGCGGLNMSGTPAGTYSFRVVGTGQGSGTTQAATVTLVVTQ